VLPAGKHARGSHRQPSDANRDPGTPAGGNRRRADPNRRVGCHSAPVLSPRAGRNGAAFLAGWYLGLVILSWEIVAFLPRPGFFSSLLGGYSRSAGLLGVLGLRLLLVALQPWRTRPRPGTPIASPPWFDRLNTLGPGHSFGIGAALASITPRMILLTLAAAVIIGRASPAPGETLAVDFFYATFVRLLAAIPVARYLCRGERAIETSTRWKDWLLRNPPAQEWPWSPC